MEKYNRLLSLAVFAFILFVSFSCSGKSEGSLKGTSIKTNAGLDLSQVTPGEALDTAVFAGGCFWCTEVYFEEIFGVRDVISGYSGGTKPNPTYSEVSSGNTDYAEAILILYNPELVSYQKLLEVFFYTMDPTQLNRQGNDVGTQYRSVVFYKNQAQKEQSEGYIKELNASGKYNKPIVTTVEAYKNFYEAEEYHQDFYKENPDHPYINAVAKPKKKKFDKEFQELLQPSGNQ